MQDRQPILILVQEHPVAAPARPARSRARLALIVASVLFLGTMAIAYSVGFRTGHGQFTRTTAPQARIIEPGVTTGRVADGAVTTSSNGTIFFANGNVYIRPGGIVTIVSADGTQREFPRSSVVIISGDPTSQNLDQAISDHGTKNPNVVPVTR
jgi:hypothetical protein